jgi:predicted XRE-type DNA-binding protein
MEKRKQKNKAEEIEYTIGSGNVYSDFGFPNPQEADTKAGLAMAITAIIKENNRTQQEAAEIIGIDQPKVSKIIRGLLSEFTIERLMKFLNNLNYDIELTLKRHTVQTTLPAIHVVMSSNPKTPEARN